MRAGSSSNSYCAVAILFFLVGFLLTGLVPGLVMYVVRGGGLTGLVGPLFLLATPVGVLVLLGAGYWVCAHYYSSIADDKPLYSLKTWLLIGIAAYIATGAIVAVLMAGLARSLLPG